MSENNDQPTEGQQFVSKLSELMQGLPVIAAASGLTATLFGVCTLDVLDQEAREMLAIMVKDCSDNILRANGITEEKLNELMAQRSAQFVGGEQEPTVQ